MSIDTPGIAGVRTREDLAAANGTTTNTANQGEVAYVANGTTSAVAVAFGSAPDAATTTATAASSAGFCLGVGTIDHDRGGERRQS